MFSVNEIEATIQAIGNERMVTGEDLPEIWALCNGSQRRFLALLQAIWDAASTHTDSNTSGLKAFGFVVDETNPQDVRFGLPESDAEAVAKN